MVELDDDSCDDMPVITTDGSSDFDTEYEPVSAFAAKARSKALTTAIGVVGQSKPAYLRSTAVAMKEFLRRVYPLY